MAASIADFCSRISDAEITADEVVIAICTCILLENTGLHYGFNNLALRYWAGTYHGGQKWSKGETSLQLLYMSAHGWNPANSFSFGGHHLVMA